jgi:hypothetical protein
MSTSPNRPVQPEEIDEETRRVLDERLNTLHDDVQSARPADEVIAELRAKFQSPAPR